ncbi:hypothetical protein BGX24_005370 [Mortierella sp. AD032]|nr:hypothetical protein BGX24_005370 [Mortierella sp. AD032]
MTVATAPVTTTIFSFDYLAHIRHLDVEWTTASYRDTPYIMITPDLNTYMRGEEYGKMCRVDRIMEAFLDDHGHDVIRKWSLGLSSLRSLMIPVADIRRYFGVIDRLVNLEQVQFLLDEVFDYGKDYEDNLTQDFVTATQQRKAESMTAICEFIREHTSLFKGQLRTITCNNGLDSNFQEQECSEETLVEIARQLPTLQRPLYLDRRNWARFIVNHQWIDLSAVEEIAYPKELKPWWFKTACEHGELLQRCRSLQKVKMMSLGPGTFRWAVQEKRDLERRDGTDTAADTTNNNNLGRQQEQEHCEFNQNGEAEEGGEGLDTARITRPHWSWNWHLPLLTCVHLTSEFAYRFEFKMLRGCPQLEILGLNMNSIDGPHTHTRVLSCADMFVLPSSSSSSPSLSVSSNVHQEERIIAPNLRSLVLSGHWVIDDTLLGELLAGMFPKLRSFTEFCSGGITLAGKIEIE